MILWSRIWEKSKNNVLEFGSDLNFTIAIGWEYLLMWELIDLISDRFKVLSQHRADFLET